MSNKAIMVTNRKKLFCNTCNNENHHELLGSKTRDYVETEIIHGEESIGWYEKRNYYFWACMGCDTASLEEQYHDASMVGYEGEEQYISIYYPEKQDVPTRKIKEFQHISKNLYSTYKEIFSAYTHSLLVICAMGVRALLEGICVTEGIDDKSAWRLENKIDKLKKASNIPQSIIDGLKSLKFIGDDAAHRLNSPSKHNIGLAIDLLEALLTHLYEARFDLEKKAQLVQLHQNKE